ncbi:MAG TPA: hypothetical protein VLR91_09355, partial [Thermodesulfobacteriota bacterium]|nr:hypothetical protein [Thermodesulfobacteriota bacterium]
MGPYPLGFSRGLPRGALNPGSPPGPRPGYFYASHRESILGWGSLPGSCNLCHCYLILCHNYLISLKVYKYMVLSEKKGV